MSTYLQTQAKAALQSSFMPVQAGFLQRKCACGQHTVAGGECEECRQNREGTMQRAAVSPTPVNSVPPVVHNVLSSPGQPLDAGTRAFMEPRFGHDFSSVNVHCEQEDDTSSLPTQAKGLILLRQLKESYLHGDHQQAVDLIQANKGPGMPLSPSVEAEMSDHFGHSFADVRIHTDPFAMQAADNLEANAFTVQQDIFFGPDMYKPDQPSGRLRIGHELAHTIQQRGVSRPTSTQTVSLEAQAERAAIPGMGQVPELSRIGPVILREPTYPRRTTGYRMLQEVERILTTTRDTKATNATVRLWSSVISNFPSSITAGSLARRVWTYLFLRHFVEPASKPGVESTHPRYFYSHTYGWIDAQHFFGFIDFAEQSFQTSSGNRQQTFEAATAKGLDIEKKQQRIRDFKLQLEKRTGVKIETDRDLFSLIDALAHTPGLSDIPALIKTLALSQLSGTERELFALLNEEQRSKLFIDSAKSAFSYEDFQSNQLGIRFFFQYGIRINSLPEAPLEPIFLSNLSSFFSSVRVENDPKEVDRLALESKLPGVERFEAPKTTEEEVRQKHPELFKLPP